MVDKKAIDKPLERYIRILEVLNSFPSGIGLSQLTVILALPKTTTYRLLQGLSDVGMIEHVAVGAGFYKLGTRFTKLVYSGVSDEWITALGQPLLKELVLQTDQACFIAKLTGISVRSIVMMAPDNNVRIYVMPGKEIVLHAGASAKAILAYHPEAFVKTLLPAKLPKYTDNTKLTRTALLDELKTVRKNGVAYCINEDVEGFAGIAVPVMVKEQEVAYSVCLTGTVRSLIEDGRKDDIMRLKHCAARLAQAIEARLPG